MTRSVRPMLLLALALAATAWSGTAAAATKTAAVKASAVKPLTLARVQDLDLGTITLSPGTWTGATVSISRAGIFSCTTARLACTGVTQVARFKVTGSNNRTVRITAPNVTMVNQTDPTSTLTLVVDSPGTITLTTSGPPGTEFSLGGAITISSSTAGGLYSGSLNVTVEYQ